MQVHAYTNGNTAYMQGDFVFPRDPLYGVVVHSRFIIYTLPWTRPSVNTVYSIDVLGFGHICEGHRREHRDNGGHRRLNVSGVLQ